MIFCSRKRNGWCWKSSTRMFSTLWQCQIIWNIYVSFTTIILYSLRSIQFMKRFVFSKKIWFLKNSTRVVKYESWVVKLNPAWLSRFWWKFNYSAPDPHKLFTLVKTYQIHFHSSICRKYKENKWRFSFGHFFRNRTIISKPLNDGLSSEQNMTN